MAFKLDAFENKLQYNKSGVDHHKKIYFLLLSLCGRRSAMAYYAALVSLVELLTEIIHPITGHPCPKYLLHKKQIICLYEKFRHLQVLLEEYFPKDEEADGFLERIRDVACLVELFIERQTSDAAFRESRMPDATYEAKGMIELREVLRYVVKNGYEDLENLKNEIDSIMGEGYLDMVKLKEEIDSISKNGYQDLVKLNEELDAISSKGYRDLDSSEEVVESIVRKGHQNLERVKEEVDSVVGRGYDDLVKKVLKKEVDPIVEELMMTIKDSHTTHQEDLQATIGGPSDGTTMVVLNENPTIIKTQLLGDSSKLEVISIVGMGGIGKTTLARQIFDDKLIHNHFDFRVWVTASQSYHLRNILLAIVDSLNMNKLELHGVANGVMRERIRKHLFGKRYLVIMDDVWDTKIWDDVKWIFPDDKKSGSRIMTTTRQSDVAFLATESDFINQISPLEYDQSWTLFCEKVHCPPELEDIGRLIVKNCGGLPLAIVLVAGLLSKVNRTRSAWEEISRGIGSTATKNDEHFSKILSLSYNYLPHHLKPCFLYFGGFPEDHEIFTSWLIKFWVAEGFVKPVASKSLEEAAEEYLEELVKRNLVLIRKQRSNGKFKCCIMHDLMRDLCLERAHHEHFLLLTHKHNATDHTHRFFIHPDSPSYIDTQKNNVRHVRSIVSFGKTQRDFISHPSSFKPLRLLSAPDTRFSFLHDGVFELLNLRLLLLICPEINIPSSISQLQYLQTLIARSSMLSEISLPAEIWEMPRLRHVLGHNLKLPPCSDDGSNKSDGLPSLQTLVTPRGFTFTSRIVEMIPSIKKLKLEYLKKSKHSKDVWRKFGLKNLVRLHQLETLAIEVEIIDFGRGNLAIPLPECFALPTNLRKLTLKGCKLPWRNMTVVGTLPHLQVLKLRRSSFVGKTWESTEGEFSKLKFLEMLYLFGIQKWRTESTHFPCLEHLVIRHCGDLKGIPSGIGEFPNLKLIQVCSTNSRVKASARKIEKEQSSVGNETLEIRVD